MRWTLSVGVRNDAGDHALAVHLRRDPEAGARTSWAVRLAVTLVLCAPLLLALGAGVLESVHILAPATSGGIAPVIRAWALVGPAVALGLNVWWSAHLRSRGTSDGSAWHELSLALDPVTVALILVSGFLVAAFYGHLLADAWACSNGVRSAC